jgi:hypothetical protein
MEQWREKAGRKIDEIVGTLPEDMSAYDTEPKQSFLSVLGGRMATLLVVLPVAMSLSKAGTDKDGNLAWKTEQNEHGFNSFNDHLFNNPGKKLAEQVSAQPCIQEKVVQHNIDVANLGKVTAFEGFYTGVCTLSQYGISRLIAGIKSHTQAQKATLPSSHYSFPNRVTIAPPLQEALAIKHAALREEMPKQAVAPLPTVASAERMGMTQQASDQHMALSS